MARAALAFREGPVKPVPAKDVVKLGAVGAVPGGPGIVVGGKIPYTPEALKIRDENRANYLDRDPEVKCYMPGFPGRITCLIRSRSFTAKRPYLRL